MVQCEHRINTLHGSRRAQKVARHRLSGTYGELMRVLSENSFDRLGFIDIVILCGRAMGIDVIDSAGFKVRIFQGQLHAASRPLSFRGRRRHMVSVAVCSIADNFAVDLGAAPDRPLSLLQDQNSRSLGDHEPIAILVKGAAGPLRLVVARGESLHRAESPHAQRSDGRFASSRNNDILKPPPNEMKSFPDGVISRGASRRRSPIDAFGSEPEGNLSRRQVRNHLGNKKGRDFARTRFKKCSVVLLDRLQPAEPDSDDHSDSLR